MSAVNADGREGGVVWKTVRDNTATGATPGTVLRSGRDTETVSTR